MFLLTQGKAGITLKKGLGHLLKAYEAVYLGGQVFIFSSQLVEMLRLIFAKVARRFQHFDRILNMLLSGDLIPFALNQDSICLIGFFAKLWNLVQGLRYSLAASRVSERFSASYASSRKRSSFHLLFPSLCSPVPSLLLFLSPY